MTSQDPGDESTAERLVGLLHDKLRKNREEALRSGSAPEEVTDDITERVRRIRELNAAGWPKREADKHDGQHEGCDHDRSG